METQIQTTEIPINATVIAGENINTANAKNIYQYLGVKTRFNDWIKRRIDYYGFIEGIDYVKFSTKSEYSNLSNDNIEYHVTLDMAKELSMVERTEKGKEARKYFIECEKRLRTIAQKTSLPIDEMWKLMRAVVRSENESQESRIAAMLDFATEALNKKLLEIQESNIGQIVKEQLALQTDKIVTLLTFQKAQNSGVKKHKTQTKRDVSGTKSESVMNMLNGNQDVVRFMDDFFSKNDAPVLIHCAVLYQQFLMFSGQSSSDKYVTSANWFGRMVRAYCQGKGITVTAKSVNLTIRVPDTENPDKVQSKYMTNKAYLFQKTELSENDKILRESGVSQSGTFDKHCGLQPETQGNQKPLLN